jgi:hypothetical protein
MGGVDIRCLEATMFCLVVRPSSSVWWMVTLTHVGISDTMLSNVVEPLTAAIETADSLFKVFLSCSSALVYLSCSAAARSPLIGALYPLISSAHMVRLRPFDEHGCHSSVLRCDASHSRVWCIEKAHQRGSETTSIGSGG